MANRYLAASGGSDGNPGTEAQPWATMAYALTQLAAGDTLYCRVGTYGEINITGTVNAGTAWDNAITVKAYGGEIAQLPRIRLAHTSVAYWIFEDLLLDGTDTQANGLLVQTGADFIRLATSEIRNYTSSGIVIDSSSNGNCEIIGNYIHDVQGNGVLVRAANNAVQGNTITGSGVWGHGIENFLTSSTAVSNNIYRGNYIYGIGTSTADIGIRIATGSGNQVVYNVIAEGDGDGIEIGLDSLNTSVYNNTIYSNVGNGIEILSTSDGGNILRNNILYQNGATIVDGRGDATTSNNLTTDPSFVNAGAGNFELLGTSAARNAGVVISGLTADFLGNPVPTGSAPDIGAFEFQGADVVLPAGYGPYASTGMDVPLLWKQRLAVAPGLFTVTGQVAAFLHEGLDILVANTGLFSYTGQAITFLQTVVSVGQLWAAGDELVSAKLRRHFTLGSMKTDGVVWYGRIRYNGTAWVVAPLTGSAGFVTGNLSFASGVLSITLTDFSVNPVPMCSALTAIYQPTVIGVSPTNLQVRWYSGQTLVTVQDAGMDIYLQVVGT